MRKVYWACAAAGLAALGLFQVAEYTCRHPEDLLTRCVIGAYHALAGRTAGARNDDEEGDIEIPDEPEPVAAGDPCPAAEELKPVPAQPCPQSTGRLPGKIVLDEGEEPPMAELRFPAQYDIEGIGKRLNGEVADEHQAPKTNPMEGLTGRAIKAVGNLFDRAKVGQPSSAMDFPPVEGRIIPAVSTEDTRQMPYCFDDDEPELLPMPYADETDEPPTKRIAPRIWNPFPPKGTEVGGADEPELNPNGNDCREDPAATLQLPGGPNSVRRAGKKAQPAAGREEESEPPPMDKKKSKRAEPPKTKRTFDESKLLPFAAPVKLDTMEFRPSDWGKNDVPVPPF